MTANEAAIRNAYQVAENKDVEGWIRCFTETGTFTDESVGVTYRGEELGRTVEVYAAAFPDMHRELFRFFEAGDTVIVELALQGTHKGPLALPAGTGAGNRQTNGRSVLRRLPPRRRQDSIIQLLSLRHDHSGSARSLSKSEWRVNRQPRLPQVVSEIVNARGKEHR